MTTAYCETTLNYARGQELSPVPVVINDGRDPGCHLNFEDCGFTLLEHHSEVTDWRNEVHLTSVHVPEISRLAAEFSGCDKVVVYPPLVRSPVTAKTHEDYAPIESVHSDFTDDYLDMIRQEDRPYRRFLEPLLAAQGLSRDDLRGASRVLMLQFWRNIGAARPDRPFALCDAATMPRNQLEAILVPEYAGERLEFEAFVSVAPDDATHHHWYTFPALTLDEVIAFRTYDSRCADEGRAFWTPHSAFLDPNAGTAAPQRESLEMRALCLFGV